MEPSTTFWAIFQCCGTGRLLRALDRTSRLGRWPVGFFTIKWIWEAGLRVNALLHVLLGVPTGSVPWCWSKTWILSAISWLVISFKSWIGRPSETMEQVYMSCNAIYPNSSEHCGRTSTWSFASVQSTSVKCPIWAAGKAKQRGSICHLEIDD